jgi:hypothetical protein
MQAGIVVALVVGWSLVLAQPLVSAHKRKDYLRSIVAFRQQLGALEMGIQSYPARRLPAEPTRPYSSPMPSYRRRQRTLASLTLSLVIGLILTAVATPIGLVLTLISLFSIVVFLMLVRASKNVAKARVSNPTQRRMAQSPVSASERAIA